jgi:hypothetical protein
MTAYKALNIDLDRIFRLTSNHNLPSLVQPFNWFMLFLYFSLPPRKKERTVEKVAVCDLSSLTN